MVLLVKSALYNAQLLVCSLELIIQSLRLVVVMHPANVYTCACVFGCANTERESV
jgi:hypothetical protein